VVVIFCSSKKCVSFGLGVASCLNTQLRGYQLPEQSLYIDCCHHQLLAFSVEFVLATSISDLININTQNFVTVAQSALEGVYPEIFVQEHLVLEIRTTLYYPIVA
jgi:hypothetical protein